MIPYLLVENMLERLDILNASTLLMSWGRAGLDNDALCDSIAKEIKRKDKEKIFYEEGAVSEIANIV